MLRKKKKRKKSLFRPWEQLEPRGKKNHLPGHGGTVRSCDRGFDIFSSGFCWFPLSHEFHLDVACLKRFHLVFRPGVDSISCVFLRESRAISKKVSNLALTTVEVPLCVRIFVHGKWHWIWDRPGCPRI